MALTLIAGIAEDCRLSDSDVIVTIFHSTAQEIETGHLDSIKGLQSSSLYCRIKSLISSGTLFLARGEISLISSFPGVQQQQRCPCFLWLLLFASRATSNRLSKQAAEFLRAIQHVDLCLSKRNNTTTTSTTEDNVAGAAPFHPFSIHSTWQHPHRTFHIILLAQNLQELT